MESLLIWGVMLVAGALLVMALDIFVPTGGVLLTLAGVSAVAGVVCLFRHSAVAGVTGALTVVVLAPSIAVFGLKIWPSTPMGRRIIGIPTEEEEAKARAEQEAEERQRTALIGAVGRVVVDLRPVGMVEIGGKRYDAKSDTFFVAAGSEVRVTGMEGNELRVRQV